MKRHNIHRNLCRAALLSLALGAATTASAQASRSGYFLDNYTYGYRLNPALASDKGFFSLPALGSLNVGMNGNLSLTDVIYHVDGRTTTFLNPQISAAEVMANLSDVNKTGATVNVNVMAGGFRAWDGYNTITLSARADVNAHLPRELFSLIKEGVANQTYDISDVRARGVGYAELALGHSHDIRSVKGLRVGGTLKFLVGMAYVDARLNRADLTLAEDGWQMVTNAEIRTNLKGLDYKMKHNDHANRDYVGGVEGSYKPCNGFGLAVDLGATYQLPMVQGLTVSAAVLDLGFINWSNTKLATTDGDREVVTDRYTFNVDGDAPNSFSNEWNIIRDDLTALYQMDNAGDIGSETHMLSATMNLGAEYELPVYRPLSFGLLNSTRFAGKYTRTEFRLSANWQPKRWFGLGINGAAGTYGASFGWLANVRGGAFNFFLGMDNTFAKIAKQGVPLASNASVTLGMNIAL